MPATARRLRAAPPPNIFDLPVWPAADMWPMLPPADLEALAADIQQRGLVVPLVTYTDPDGGQWLLDGRNRRAVLDQIDGDPRSIEYQGDDPDGYVLSMNLQRRHLNVSQRAVIYAMTVTTESSGGGTVSNETVTIENAASTAGIGRSRVIDARYLLDHDHQDRIAEIIAGVATVSASAKAARWKDQQDKDAADQAGKLAAEQAEKDAADLASRAVKLTDIETYAPQLLTDFTPDEYTSADLADVFQAFDSHVAQASQTIRSARDRLDELGELASLVAASLQPDYVRLAAWAGVHLDPDALTSTIEAVERVTDALRALTERA